MTSPLQSAGYRVHEAKDRATDCKEAAADAAEAIKSGDTERCLRDLARLKSWAERLVFDVGEAELAVKSARTEG